MQRDELIVTRPEQARALQDSGFLARFLEPASPSDVARSLGIPANLAHHHARRHAELGLLEEVRREGGKVYYQLVARTFKHDRTLLPAGDPDEHTAVMTGLLRDRFLRAYERSDRFSPDGVPSWHTYGFDREARPEEPEPRRPTEGSESHPAHLQLRTVSLSPKSYRELVRKVARLIIEAEAEDEEQAQPCTLAFLAMAGVLQEGSTDSRYLSTFVPPAEEGDEPKSWQS
jgi:DNA-binding transcriptional ArsR family regulator